MGEIAVWFVLSKEVPPARADDRDASCWGNLDQNPKRNQSQHMDNEKDQPSTPSRAQLRELAAQGRKTIAVYEGGRALNVLLWMLALLCVVPGLAMLSFARQGGLLVASAFLLIGIAFGALGRALGRRRKVPFLTLGEQGLHYADLTQPIPWTAIENYRVGAGTHRGENLIVFVDLSQGYEVPLRDKNVTSAWHSVRRAWYNAKENWIIFKATGVRGMTNPELVEHLSTYWQAGLARAQLGNLDESLVG